VAGIASPSRSEGGSRRQDSNVEVECHGGANKSGMNLLPPLQHCNKLLNLPSASLRFFYRLNSPKDPVSVRPVKSLEKRCGLGIRVQRSLKVGRDGRSAGRIISSIPSAILLGILDRFQPGGLHLPTRNQRQRVLPVNLRPDALARTRNKPLQPRLFAFRLLLSVDPSVAQCNFERFPVSTTFADRDRPLC